MKNQVARNDPGNTVPAFWTVSVQPPNFQLVDLRARRALQLFPYLKTLDWGTFKNNTLADTVPSVVAWTARWGPPSEAPETVVIDNETRTPPQRYNGNPIIEDTASIEWAMFEPKPNSILQGLGFAKDFLFISDRPRTSTSIYAQIGFESNGSLWVSAKPTPPETGS